MKHPDEMDEFELITYHTIVDDARAEEEQAAKEAAEAAARPAAEPVLADAAHTGEEDCPYSTEPPAVLREIAPGVHYVSKDGDR